MTMFRSIVAGFFLALAGCANSPPAVLAPPAAIEVREPVTILVSVDGFRADYLERGVSPNLRALADGGVRAAMRPSFPSVTFPNHYTLVTGLRPDRHGVVGNAMEDAASPARPFTMASSEPLWWTQAEPIWITAERAGVRTATMFWPGSNVDHGGVRPRDWHLYAMDVTARQRVDSVIDWLRRPAATRPRFLTLYFEAVDTAGHVFGPGAAETNAAIAGVDAEIGRLRRELAALGQPANLVIVADHGMAATAPDRVIRLDRIADPASFRTIYGGAYAAIEAQPGREDELARRLLARHAHMQCWRKGELPPALHYGRNPRVPRFICLPESGWLVLPAAPPPDRPVKAGGAHGYDPAHADMAALFVVNGPAFVTDRTLPPFDNVHVYPLLARLIGVAARPSDGDAAVTAAALRP